MNRMIRFGPVESREISTESGRRSSGVGAESGGETFSEESHFFCPVNNFVNRTFLLCLLFIVCKVQNMVFIISFKKSLQKNKKIINFKKVLVDFYGIENLTRFL